MADGDTEDDPAGENDGRDSGRIYTAKRGREAWTHRRYRVGTVALGVLGVGMAFMGVLFSSSRTVLFALSGIGLFGAVLLYVLVPERFVTATLARRTYVPLADIGPLLVDTSGLTDRRVYVPDGEEGRLIIPADTVAGDENRTLDRRESGSIAGLSLPTTGNGLLSEYYDRGHGPLATDAEELAIELLDGLVEEFELVDHASGRVFSSTNRAVIEIEGSQYGPPTTFDHPVTAFLAAGLAVGLETPVTIDQPERTADGHYVVEYRWQEPIAAEEWRRPSTADATGDWEFSITSSIESADEPAQ